VKRTPQIPVAVFLTSFHPGGTERQMIELIRGLDRAQFDVHAVCFNREGAWLTRAESVAPVTEFFVRGGLARRATLVRAMQFARWCRDRRIAVVQTCDFYANTIALPAAAFANVPVRIGSRRELAPDKTSAQLALQRQAYRCAHAIVANSLAAAGLLRREGISDARVRVIPNGVDAGRSHAHREWRPIRAILTVANLRREKAHEILFDAVARLAPTHPDLRVRIAGDGPRAAELRALAATLGIAERVSFLGHRDDIDALFADADLFVLPSRSEAFPNSVVEAMAAGLPVVATTVGGLPELVEPDRTGLLVPPDDGAALAQAIASLIAHPERARVLGDKARETVARRYSFDRMVRAFERLYLSQLELASQAA
jgi:glycosyltransferase involved in cell wall biosynthesis